MKDEKIIDLFYLLLRTSVQEGAELQFHFLRKTLYNVYKTGYIFIY